MCGAGRLAGKSFGEIGWMKKSRTEYSVRNTTVAVIARICAILAGFITRIVFTHMIRQEYVGVNSLFADILNALAFSESGIDTCLLYTSPSPRDS